MAGLHDIARVAGIKDSEAQEIFESIIAHVNAGERVVIKNFGVFFMVETQPRMVKSPVLKKMEGIDQKMIPGYRYLRFKPSKLARRVVKPPSPSDLSGEARGTQKRRLAKSHSKKSKG
jgi:nucleoid DNA-binding protein